MGMVSGSGRRTKPGHHPSRRCGGKTRPSREEPHTMDGEERERLARVMDHLAGGLEEERSRHEAGLEPEPALARLFPPSGAAAHPEMVKRLRAAGDEATAR